MTRHHHYSGRGVAEPLLVEQLPVDQLCFPTLTTFRAPYLVSYLMRRLDARHDAQYSQPTPKSHDNDGPR